MINLNDVLKQARYINQPVFRFYDKSLTINIFALTPQIDRLMDKRF